nr:MAG TPA: hypothetical protein [Caudoviricetes sp.]
MHTQRCMERKWCKLGVNQGAQDEAEPANH